LFYTYDLSNFTDLLRTRDVDEPCYVEAQSPGYDAAHVLAQIVALAPNFPEVYSRSREASRFSNCPNSTAATGALK
jgi:hypothetical protein